MKLNKLFRLGLAAAGTLTLAAVASAQTTHVVSLSGFAFTPSNLVIDMGDTVNFVWGTGLHNVVSGSGGTPDGAFDSGVPQNGPNTYSVLFDADFLAANTRANNAYPIYCDVHVTFGMTGTIRVKAPFAVNNTTISLGSGGVQGMSIDAGVPNAGQLYWVLGTTAGFSPGFGGLPLNFSNYLLFTINSPNLLIANQLSVLDANGRSTASLLLPPGLDPALAGVVFHHAAVAFDFAGNTLLVSNASSLTLAP